MFLEDDRPRKSKVLLIPPVLDDLSISELEHYIAELSAEIDRVKTDIAKKQAHMKAVEGIFKS